MFFDIFEGALHLFNCLLYIFVLQSNSQYITWTRNIPSTIISTILFFDNEPVKQTYCLYVHCNYGIDYEIYAITFTEDYRESSVIAKEYSILLGQE